MGDVAVVNVRLPLWGRSLLLGKHPRNDQLLEMVLFKNVKVQFRPGFLEPSAGM